MFIGEYLHKMDVKGRTSLPSKFKKNIGDTLIITRGFDNSLTVYTESSWKEITEKLSKLSITKKAERSFTRMMLSGAIEVSPDKQGRILIPEYLRKYAGIETEIVWAGVGDKAEIWDKAKWDVYLDESIKNSEEIADSLDGVV